MGLTCEHERLAKLVEELTRENLDLKTGLVVSRASFRTRRHDECAGVGSETPPGTIERLDLESTPSTGECCDLRATGIGLASDTWDAAEAPPLQRPSSTATSDASNVPSSEAPDSPRPSDNECENSDVLGRLELQKAWHQVTSNFKRAASSRVRGARSDRQDPNETTFQRYFILRPDSMRRLLWDFLSLLMVTHDVVSLPLEVFDLPSSFVEFMIIMDWVVTFFWTVDIPVSLTTGFHAEGCVEIRPRKIAARYVKKRLPF
eukprot:CAMPEP_0194522972 /NCGR_PEP_ID=MMETSP0253-20130528/57739_1 /TAXON_ID=2966 /ORGANISM="Noctiluca scintillans" /LENGTH=260 /DNA_ID=CAMNT_0039367463 /DNA_START=150 /DNA_END=929 /DNA_ORIENTATION=+